jgi:hypothetical protein
MSGVKNHLYTANSQISNYTTQTSFADEIAEQERLERAREEQRRRVQAQIQAMQKAIQIPANQMNQDMNRSVQHFNQQINQIYQANANNVNQVDANIQNILSTIETQVSRVIEQHKKENQKALETFRNDLTNKNQSQSLQFQQYSELFEQELTKLSPLIKYDTTNTISQLQQSFQQVQIMAQSSPQAALGSIYSLFSRAQLTQASLADALNSDLIHQAAVTQEIILLEAKITEVHNLEYTTIHENEQKTFIAEVDHWTNQKVTAITNRLEYFKKFMQTNTIDLERQDEMISEIKQLNHHLKQLVSNAKGDLLANLTARSNLKLLHDQMIKMGWRRTNIEEVFQDNDYKLYYQNDQGDIFHILIDRNKFRTEMFSNTPHENRLNDKEIIDQALKSRIYGETITSPLKSVCDGPIEQVNEEVIRRAKNQLKYAKK